MSKTTEPVSDRADFQPGSAHLQGLLARAAALVSPARMLRRMVRQGTVAWWARPASCAWGHRRGSGFLSSCLESCHSLALLSGYSLTFWHQPQASRCELQTSPTHALDCFPVLNAPFPGFLSSQALSSMGPWHALFWLPESFLSLPHSGVLDSTSYAMFVLYIDTPVCCPRMGFSSTELSRC